MNEHKEGHDESATTGDPQALTLVWPPKKEDLERLYLVERLSAMKIAKAYGLKYASPKTAESTVLYQLKRNGITRRSCVEHIAKVTEAMVDEWVKHYQNGESLAEIAGDAVDPVTVFNHLHRRGLQLRDKEEAKLKAIVKHAKTSFDGNEKDQAYLVGIARGDFYVTQHGNAVRVKVGTTHPAMKQLFHNLFSSHGPIYGTPKRSVLTGFEWSLDADLDQSFNFLLNIQSCPPQLDARLEIFIEFLAGFFDADGSIFYHQKTFGGAFEFNLSNTDDKLLRRIGERLSEFGFHPTLTLDKQSPTRGVKNGGEFIWRLHLWRYEDVARLIEMIPSRHSEKVEKMKIALGLKYRATSALRADIHTQWAQLQSTIRKECQHFIAEAESIYLGRRPPGSELRTA